MTVNPEPPLDLDAIRARADAATPGLWTAVEDGGSGEFYDCEASYDIECSDDRVDVARGGFQEDGGPHVGAIGEADAEFIAAARSDVPALVAELRAARGALQAVRDLIDTTRRLQGTDPDSGDWDVSALALLDALDPVGAVLAGTRTENEQR